MSYQQMAADDELAHLQKLSNEYTPEATGPLVGPRQSTAAITTEYANGDPIYRAKTQNLPYKYSHYRTCRGDGHCGWRAVAFGYFEALQRVGDRHKFLEEQSRLRSLANLLNQIGLQADVYEDFADETLGLLGKLAKSPTVDDRLLLEAFNDQMASLGIITHLKASVHMTAVGHYDILYKAEEVQSTMAPQMPTQVAVNLAPHFNEDYVHMSREFSDVLAYIPGMGPQGFAPSLGQPSYMSDPFASFSPTPSQPPPQPTPQLYSPLSVPHSQDSHYNTAHFLNPDFQPEEWSPDTEYSSNSRGRHKSTSQ
ncbi:hypothetical protein SLS54_000448 [Diplodia seriata]